MASSWFDILPSFLRRYLSQHLLDVLSLLDDSYLESGLAEVPNGYLEIFGTTIMG
jgi:hypothetical protein